MMIWDKKFFISETKFECFPIKNAESGLIKHNIMANGF